MAGRRVADPLWHARYWEWEAAIFGGSFVAFAVGALAGQHSAPYAEWLLIMGAPLYGWGMFRIHRRNAGPRQ